MASQPAFCLFEVLIKKLTTVGVQRCNFSRHDSAKTKFFIFHHVFKYFNKLLKLVSQIRRLAVNGIWFRGKGIGINFDQGSG